jgi:hypothetical protein
VPFAGGGFPGLGNFIAQLGVAFSTMIVGIGFFDPKTPGKSWVFLETGAFSLIFYGRAGSPV